MADSMCGIAATWRPRWLGWRKFAGMKISLLWSCLLAAALAAAPACAADEKKAEPAASSQDDTFDQDSVLRDAEEFFGKGAEGLAKVIEKAFKEQGRPNGYIKGEEAS